MNDMRERERERFIFRQLGPGVGIWRLPQVQHVAPSTGRLSYRPAVFLSINEQYEVREENR